MFSNFRGTTNTAINPYSGMPQLPIMPQQPNNTPKPILVGVHGFDSIKKFPTEPNQTLSFHDMDADFEYIVDTDVNNQPSYKIVEYSVISEEEYREKYKQALNKDEGLPTPEEWKKTLERLERLEKEVSENNAKQSVQYQKSNASKYANNGSVSAKPATRSENCADVSVFKEQ